MEHHTVLVQEIQEIPGMPEHRKNKKISFYIKTTGTTKIKVVVKPGLMNGIINSIHQILIIINNLS